ncbi:MAG: hypothetical protein ACLR7Z_18905 [Bilophila wadsworthia]
MSANLISAVHDLVLESGLGAKNIAAAVGKPYSTLLREVNPSTTARNSARNPRRHHAGHW